MIKSQDWSPQWDQLVIPHHQLPRLHLCSMFLFDDIFSVANPRSLAEEWPVHAFFWRHLKQPRAVFRDCFRKCAQMSALSERCVFQLVGMTLVIMPAHDGPDSSGPRP